MKKPRYIENMYAFIFLCLGVSFLIIGLLSFTSIVKPSAHSYVQDPIIMGTIFSMFGVAFIILQTIFRIISHMREKSHIALCSSGMKIKGTIEKVRYLKYTNWGNKSPYRIYYTYESHGEIYHHKSYLLWEKPNLYKGDSIIVYTDGSRKSTIQF